MEIAVQARHMTWNEEMRRQVERSVAFAIDRHKDRVERISVCLTDLNGPRGGIDKLCQITAHIRGAGPVLILERGGDLAAVVNRATRRLGYRIARSLQRRRVSGTREHRATIRAA